tara:strand:+ start:6211 stop:6942 length:732 start_codon:yes stop_codon:yes gene_type:complete
MKEKRILVLGYGMLGQELVKQTGWDYRCIEEHGFDITKPDDWWEHLLKVEFGAVQYCPYDIIINCVANTNTYSKDRDTHWDVNYKGTDNIVEFCNRWSLKLVQISTDYIYGGGMPNKNETDVPVHCDNWYSYTKLLSDAHVQLKSNDYLMVRIGHKKRPFTHKVAYHNMLGNFDYTDVIAEMIIKMVKRDLTGIYNVGSEAKSMYDLAKQTKVDVVPGRVEGTDMPACVLMNLDKFKALKLSE